MRLPPRRETAQIGEMRYLALAADYDETLAANGQVRGETFAALSLLRKTGRRTILVTGRLLPDLLPKGLDKGTGLAAALDELGLSLRNTVAVGDAENDQAMLAASPCGVAVANALAALKDGADLVLRPAAAGAAGLSRLDTILAAGDRPEETLRPFGGGRPARLLEGEVLSWSNGQIEPLRLLAGEPRRGDDLAR